MRIISFLIVLLVIIVGVTFSLLNSQTVLVNYYVGQHQLPLSFLLMITFAAGCLLAILVGFIIVLKLKLKNYRLCKQLKATQKELEDLRSVSLRKQL